MKAWMRWMSSWMTGYAIHSTMVKMNTRNRSAKCMQRDQSSSLGSSTLFDSLDNRMTDEGFLSFDLGMINPLLAGDR